MPVTINGNTGVVTGLAVGGLPDGIVDRDTLATQAKGSILQVVQTVKKDVYSASVSAHSTASANAIEVAITPTSSSNKILIMISAHASSSYWGSVCCGAIQGFLVKDGSILVQGDAASNRQRMTMRAGDSDNSNIEEPLNFNYLDSPSTTSAVTYGLRLHNSDNGSATLYLNRSDNDTDQVTTITRTVSTITAMEVAA